MTSEKKYKIMSIRQPQAWAVCVGEKTVENKPKSTSYRGPLLIHAGKNKDGLRDLEELPGWQTYKGYFQLGAIIGTAELYDAVDFNRSLEINLHASGPCCYLLRNARWFQEPIPCTGQLGIFNLPEHFVAAVQTQLNKPGRAVQIPDELLQAIRPHPSDACCYQAEYYLEHDQIDDALRRLEGAIKLDPQNATAYYGRSLVHDAEDRMEEAIRDVSKAIELEPENPQYHYQRGYYNWSADRLQESLRDYTTAIELEPEFDMAYVMRAVSFRWAGDNARALGDLARGQAINEGNVLARLIKCGVLVETGRFDEGINELRVAEELFDDHPAPSYLLYWANRKHGRSQAAAAALERFHAKDGDEDDMRAHMKDWGFDF